MRPPPDRRDRRPGQQNRNGDQMHIGGGIPDSVRPWPAPSNYSLTALELARHVRQLRRGGWQSWEITVRFDFSHLDAA